MNHSMDRSKEMSESPNYGQKKVVKASQEKWKDQLNEAIKLLQTAKLAEADVALIKAEAL